ncbi:hypothetical protein KXX41_006937 [Aspergillus fumigatus]|nr:hypothetical protein KXX41_006937 [Aspergillus fumigatus]
MAVGPDRVLVQGMFEDFKFHGVVCVVRWSFREEVFGNGQAFGLSLATCLGQVRQFYGGRVRECEDVDAKEEYLAVLIFKSRGTKRVPRNMYPFSVVPLSVDRRVFHDGGVGRMTLYLPKRYVGSYWYSEFRRNWCYRVRDDCEQHFGSLGIVLGEEVSADSEEVGVRGEMGCGGSVRVNGSEDVTVNGSEDDGGGSEGRRLAERFASVGAFGRRVERVSSGMVQSGLRDVNRLRALIRRQRLMVKLTQLEFMLAERGEELDDEDDNMLKDVLW